MVNSEGRAGAEPALPTRWAAAVPPGLDIALFAGLLAVNAWTGGEIARLELSGNALRLSEIALVLIALVAVVRHGPRRTLELLLARAAPLWLALLAVAGIVAAARGLAGDGLSAIAYDLQLLAFLLAAPVVVLLADTRRRAAWLLGAVVVIVTVATLLFVGAEAIARLGDSGTSLLADQEGEIGTGAFYASLALAAALPLIARSARLRTIGFATASLSLLLIGLADKRAAWVAVVAAVAVAFVAAGDARRRLLGGVALLVVVLGVSFAVDSATEVAPEGGRVDTVGPRGGPLEGDFEDGIGDWRVFGTAEAAELETTDEWSAQGRRSLRVEAVASADEDNVYAFACDCCSEGGGAEVEPGETYTARAIVRPEEVPDYYGVELELIFYPDDGTFDRITSHDSLLKAGDEGRPQRLEVSGVAPDESGVVGLRIGPGPLAAGERTSFDVDEVSVGVVRRRGLEGLECQTAGGDDEGASGVEREVTGLLGGGDGTPEAENVAWRIDYWQELMGRLGDEPAKILAGAGFGPIEYVREGVEYDFRVSSSGDDNNTSGPHNAFVGALYQMGIVGLAGLAGVLVTAALCCRRGLRGDEAERLRAAGLAGMLAVAVAYMCFTEALRAAELGLFAWTLIGLCLASWPPARRERRPAKGD